MGAVRFHEQNVVEEDLGQVNISINRHREIAQTHCYIGIFLDIVVRMSLCDLLDGRFGVWFLSERHGCSLFCFLAMLTMRALLL